jgi:hypothetical protein
MGDHFEATFKVTNWDEQPIDERSGTAKLTRAVVTKTYAGDITGESVTEWLMAYAEGGDATFVGMERLVGTIGDRDGTLVLRHVGTFADGAARAVLQVVAGGGSGALASTTGNGHFLADPSGSVTLDLESA